MGWSVQLDIFLLAFLKIGTYLGEDSGHEGNPPAQHLTTVYINTDFFPSTGSKKTPCKKFTTKWFMLVSECSRKLRNPNGY